MQLNKLFLELNIEPKNLSYYISAFTHSTFANEKRYDANYQRQEFLGDAVIDYIVTDYIFEKYEKLSEGEMSLLRAKVVSTDTLSFFSDKLKLISYCRFGKGSNELIKNTKIKADLFESLSAAIYQDQGMKTLKLFFENNLFKMIDEQVGLEVKNPKTILQELLQTESREDIKYVTKKIKEIFKSKVLLGKTVYGYGEGNTKKQAEVNAAVNALEKAE